MEAACQWFEAQLRAPYGAAAMDYLRGRGLREETIRSFRLGFAPEAGSGTQTAMQAQGRNEPPILEGGM